MTTEEELVRIVTERLARIGTRCLALRAIPDAVLVVRRHRDAPQAILLIATELPAELVDALRTDLRALLAGADYELV